MTLLICFLDLQFVDLVYPTKIEILETYNPGAVVRILALESGSLKKRRFVLWFAVFVMHNLHVGSNDEHVG